MLFTSRAFWAALSSALQMTRDAHLIVTARTPILAKAALTANRGLDPEIAEMASEKLIAFVEGAAGAQQGLARLAAGMFAGESLPKLMRRAEAIGLAACRPARRRVRANAKRLKADRKVLDGAFTRSE
ncbi:MAG: hypothetical protein JO216_21115 [Hyphomicrobiales bacterium]|nr:hypothetical protein [Hyphomicrobiales bacterium]